MIIILRQFILLLCVAVFMEGYTSVEKSFYDGAMMVISFIGGIAAVFWNSINKIIKEIKKK